MSCGRQSNLYLLYKMFSGCSGFIGDEKVPAIASGPGHWCWIACNCKGLFVGIDKVDYLRLSCHGSSWWKENPDGFAGIDVAVGAVGQKVRGIMTWTVLEHLDEPVARPVL